MKRCIFISLALIGSLLALSGCSSSDPVFESAVSEVKVDGNNPYLRDVEGRYVHMRGLNISGASKVPILNTKDAPGFTYGRFDYRRCDLGGEVGYCPMAKCTDDEKSGACRCASGECKSRADIEKVDAEAFKHPGRPFPLAEGMKGAQRDWWGQIQALGFNSVRLLFMWEAFFPEMKGKLDAGFVNYLDELTYQANEHNVYVLFNMHENLWSRHLYSLYNNFPLCQTCCVYDENDHPIKPDGTVLSDQVCRDDDPVANPASKKNCCLPGDIMNQIWSLVPSRKTADLMNETPQIAGRSPYLNGYNDRTSGDGAPLWATKVCLPEKNFDSPYWGTFKLLGTMQKCASGKTNCGKAEFYTDLTGAIGYLAGKANSGDPVVPIPAETLEKVENTYKAIEAYLPPTPGFEMEDTNDFLPATFWPTNAAISLNGNRCYASFFMGDKIWPKARVIETYAPDKKAEGVVTKTFFDPESAAALKYVADEKTAGRTVSEQKTLKDALQESYYDVWKAVAHMGKKHTNVVGYDLMNEPSMVWVLLTAVSLSFELGLSGTIGKELDKLLVGDDGAAIKIGTQTAGGLIYHVLQLLDLLPPDLGKKWMVNKDCKPEYCTNGYYDATQIAQWCELNHECKMIGYTDDEKNAIKARWGMQGADMGAAVGATTSAIDKLYLQPLFEHLGQAVLAEYCPDKSTGGVDCTLGRKPLIWIESTLSVSSLLNSFMNSSSTGGAWKQYMTAPKYPSKYGTVPLVYSPHWYPDIYPFLGFNQPSRIFEKDQYKYQDYSASLASGAAMSPAQLGDIPVVYGEFGNYWNFQTKEYLDRCVSKGCVCAAGEGCKRSDGTACAAKQQLCRPGYQQDPYPTFKGTDGLPANENDIYSGDYTVGGVNLKGNSVRCMKDGVCQSVADKGVFEAVSYDEGVTYDPQSYHLSTHILDNYYEGFEKLFMSNIQWVYTAGTDCIADGELCIPSSPNCSVTALDNSFCANHERCCVAGKCSKQTGIEKSTISGTNPDGSVCRFVRDPKFGDLWSHEDFSMLDQWGRPRGWVAYQRPYPRSISGKPIAMHFYAPLHIFDPAKGKVNPEREFALTFEAKKSDAPTILYVPKMQYPEGFYVWVSDGWVGWDAANQLLYFHPTNDDPGAVHAITLRPPLYGDDVSGWAYFVKDGKVVSR